MLTHAEKVREYYAGYQVVCAQQVYIADGSILCIGLAYEVIVTLYHASTGHIVVGVGKSEGLAWGNALLNICKAERRESP